MMKPSRVSTRPQARPRERFHRILQTAFLAATGLSLLAPGFAGESQSSATASDQGYTIFLGLNVFVEEQEKSLPVVGGSDREVLVREEGTGAAVPRREVPLSALLEPKLSRKGLTIEALDGFPVYSPAANPVADAQSQMIAMQNIDADRGEAAETNARQAEHFAMAAGVQAARTPTDSPERGAADAAAASARDAAESALSDMASAISNPRFGDFMPGAGADGRKHDGFEVSFRVSATEPCTDAYGVLRLILRRPEPAGMPVQQALKLFRLPPLDAKPRKVVVRRFDLPVGATIESYEIHVYVDGRELASNTSRNRLEVTDDEALQFVILRHAQRHGAATVPAAVAEELRPAWPRGATPAESSKLTVNLGITVDGKVSAVDWGVAASSPATHELDQAVHRVRFLPALVSGRPVASTGTFALGELFRDLR